MLVIHRFPQAIPGVTSNSVSVSSKQSRVPPLSEGSAQSKTMTNNQHIQSGAHKTRLSVENPLGSSWARLEESGLSFLIGPI